MVKVIRELPLKQFKFWSGAEQTAVDIADGDWDTLEETINDIFPEGIEETVLNDIFWFDTDFVAEWLGYSSWEDYLHRDKTTDDD